MVPGPRIILAVDFVADDPCLVDTVTKTWEGSAFGGHFG